MRIDLCLRIKRFRQLVTHCEQQRQGLAELATGKRRTGDIELHKCPLRPIAIAAGGLHRLVHGMSCVIWASGKVIEAGEHAQRITETGCGSLQFHRWITGRKLTVEQRLCRSANFFLSCDLDGSASPLYRRRDMQSRPEPLHNNGPLIQAVWVGLHAPMPQASAGTGEGSCS